MAHGMLIREGANPDGPDSVRIAYVIDGREYVCDIFPPGTPHGPQFDDLAKRLNVPVQVLRAYRGKELLEERRLKARGA
jgi:hypothetical protein